MTTLRAIHITPLVPRSSRRRPNDSCQREQEGRRPTVRTLERHADHSLSRCLPQCAKFPDLTLTMSDGQASDVCLRADQYWAHIPAMNPEQWSTLGAHIRGECIGSRSCRSRARNGWRHLTQIVFGFRATLCMDRLVGRRGAFHVVFQA